MLELSRLHRLDLNLYGDTLHLTTKCY